MCVILIILIFVQISYASMAKAVYPHIRQPLPRFDFWWHLKAVFGHLVDTDSTVFIVGDVCAGSLQ